MEKVKPSKPFGYVYDDVMAQHACPYDPEQTTQDRPERAVLIHKRLCDDGLLTDAVKIELRQAEDWELQLNHPKELVDELEGLKTLEEMEDYCRWHELLWLCPESANVARLTVGGVIDLVAANVHGRIGNGFAITRPPGHHSYAKMPQGFCIFNNVAIAAKYAVQKLGVQKILILDVDFHCGNGNYHSLKGDDHFLYVNFHAYHHGAFWPYDREFDYDTKYSNVISIPLNAPLNSEGDYMGAMRHLVLPIAEEFGTQMVIVSLGFDSAYYDDLLEHGQGVKAHGYGHIMNELTARWPDKVIAVLEGGYHSFSYTECASMTTRALKGLPVPSMVHPKRLNPCMAETIWNNLCHHAKNYRCVAQHLEDLQQMQLRHGECRYVEPASTPFVATGLKEVWDRVLELRVARTRDWVPGMSPADRALAKSKILEYIQEYDYVNPTAELSAAEFEEQLLWDSERAGSAYLLAIPAVQWFHDGMRACLATEAGKYIIIDMYTYRIADRMQREKMAAGPVKSNLVADATCMNGGVKAVENSKKVEKKKQHN